MPLNALSHLSLTAPQADLFNKTVDFYSQLGFRVISKLTEEAWLHLFPSEDSYSKESGTDGITLRIALNDREPFDAAAFEKARTENGKTLEAVASLSGVAQKAWGCFVVDNLASIESSLGSLGHPFVVKKNSSVAPNPAPQSTFSPSISILSYDPLGNLIAFTDQKSPFSKVDPERPLRAKPTIDKTTLASVDSLVNLENYLPLENDGHSTQSPSRSGGDRVAKKIGVLTSGGDSSGMNAAVRAVTRVALQKGCIPFGIYEGYEGLVEGGDKIKQLKWDDVRGLLSIVSSRTRFENSYEFKGGTAIGTARSARFRTREGRLQAAFNMIKNGIDALIVVGGDGSLTGADKLRGEWKELVDELVATGKLKKEECEHLRNHLTIVGLVGSIDNDMSATALSHQRAFVVEVMGRHCGWLGLMAAIAIGADWVFLPERPPPMDTAKYGENWEEEMCERLNQNRKIGNRKTIVIVCEGAIDRQLKPLKAEDIKTVIETRLGLDTRVTTLGHVQRGGTPCAYDRYLATVQGVEAVEAVLRSTPETPSPMIGMSQNKITAFPLMDAVKLTKDVAEAIARKDFKRAMELRDPDFTAAYDAYIESHILSDDGKRREKQLRIGIIHIGAPAGGMNAATRIAARLCLNRGHVPLGIRNGFSGLIRDEIAPLTWPELIGWQVKGGSELGTNRDHPQPPSGGIPGAPKMHPKGATNLVDCGLIAYHLQKHNIQALLIIGGFEAFTSLVTLSALRSTYPAFCIPMVALPATISNNVPGTDFSIGSDTALNAIVESCDRIKLSATASQKRVFVVEVQGGNCGYLAVLAGLAAGATNVYIPEEGISIDMLQRDIKHLCNRYNSEQEDSHGLVAEGRVILRSEYASSDTYSTDVISNILKAEGKGIFGSRTAVLGHLQQGGVPSPLDRIRATRLAVNCVDWIEESYSEALATNAKETRISGRSEGYTANKEHACVIGIQGARVVFSPVETLLAETDMAKRRGKAAWWMGFTRLIRVLSKYYYHEDEKEKEKIAHAAKDSETGVDVCLSCYNGGCRDSDRAHSKLHSQKFSHPLVLNLKRVAKTRGEDEPPTKITKLAIQVESDEEKYDTIYTVRCFSCGDVEVNQDEGNLKAVVDGVKAALSSKKQSDIKAWEEEIVACEHTKNLVQGEAKNLETQGLAHCNNCDLKENLWLCLVCGNLGCGRHQYGGLGGNGHGVGHFDATRHSVSVKLGTITPEGTADVYCYICDEGRLDPFLSRHLANFGINTDSQQKTEKSIAELQLEQNLKFDFSMTTEDGKDLTPLFGGGYTGLKNLGNTCYLASVMQTVFAIPAFKERYSAKGQEHIRSCRNDASQCFHCQMAKLCDGIESGRYSMPVFNDEGEIRGQDGISPSMFKNLIGKGHHEFSSMRQQDAQEFFQHLLKTIEQKERATGSDPTDVFKFATEQRLQCTECKNVRYKKDSGVTLIQLPVPAKKDTAAEAAEDTYLPVTYEECLETFTSPEARTFTCSTCKKQTVLTWHDIFATKFATFPKILVTPMSRFVIGSNYVMKKLNVDISVPLSLDLSAFQSTGLQSDETQFPEEVEAPKLPTVDAEAMSQLMGMGFTELRATKALIKTGNNGAEVAMSWLFEHLEDPDIDDPIEVGGGPGAGGASEEELGQIMDMGFTLTQAKRAMKETNNSLERAVDWLFNHGHEIIDEDMDDSGAGASAAPAADTPGSPKYELFAFVSHRGPSAHCGHYVAHLKIDGKWALFNDNKVVEVENIEKASKEAYIYYYAQV
ncbi:6-phosphofructokinase, alpha subunit [Phlyctochytrium planicorne]|nr:6-phosphofructokinase, alpha subunit [Phlyctochytrium planicorne]